MAQKIESTPFEEALEKTGDGLYNVLLVLTCGLILLAMGVDMFGFSLVVAAACDLNITVSQKGILTSLPYIGILLVSYAWGYVSDTRGRRLSLMVSMQAAFVLSCVSSIATNWLLLAMIKFFAVCFSCAANSVAYTLLGESCVQRVRNKYMLLVTCLLILSPGIGALLTYPVLTLNFQLPIPLLGINFSPWRLLIIVLAIPSGIGGIAICFCHESPKFLANSGKTDEALKVLRSMHEINNRNTKEEFDVTSVYLEDAVSKKPMTFTRALFEQGAPLFRPPLLWRTLQLYFIISIVYFTNNSLLIWLPYIMNLVRLALNHNTTSGGDICSLISSNVQDITNNSTTTTSDICLGYIEDNIIITLVIAQCIYAFLNFIISYLMRWRKIVLLTILCISTLSGVVLGFMPEPISSVFLLMSFSCTNLGMGILAAYFVDLYPTSCRGMVACLSIMVARTSTFVGINVIGNLIFSNCQVTFYIWSMVVFNDPQVSYWLFSVKQLSEPVELTIQKHGQWDNYTHDFRPQSSVVAAWFLPPDKPPQG